MKQFSFSDFTGVMGSTEMECAVARMLNLAADRGVMFENLGVVRNDFNSDGYDRDGFDELVYYGWLHADRVNGSFVPVRELTRRIVGEAFNPR